MSSKTFPFVYYPVSTSAGGSLRVNLKKAANVLVLNLENNNYDNYRNGEVFRFDGGWVPKKIGGSHATIDLAPGDYVVVVDCDPKRTGYLHFSKRNSLREFSVNYEPKKARARFSFFPCSISAPQPSSKPFTYELPTPPPGVAHVHGKSGSALILPHPGNS